MKRALAKLRADQAGHAQSVNGLSNLAKKIGFQWCKMIFGFGGFGLGKLLGCGVLGLGMFRLGVFCLRQSLRHNTDDGPSIVVCFGFVLLFCFEGGGGLISPIPSSGNFAIGQV